jgi:hypothetical protein
MKTIKYFLVVIAVSISSLIFAQTSNPLQIDINNTTDRGQLWQIHEQLKTQGLVFQYDPVFDSERRLTHLKYSIVDNNGNVVVAQSETQGNIQKGTSVHITLIKENNVWKKQ